MVRGHLFSNAVMAHFVPEFSETWWPWPTDLKMVQVVTLSSVRSRHQRDGLNRQTEKQKA